MESLFLFKIHTMTNGIIILDFGSQYNQLIARKIRNFGVYAEILPYHTSLDIILSKQPKGIILSGEAASVMEADASLIDAQLFAQGIPILGIDYGMQTIVHLLGGKVETANEKAYHVADFEWTESSVLFDNVPQVSSVWLSQLEVVQTLPEGFKIGGKSLMDIASIVNDAQKIYGVQFHPEVSHSDFGSHIIENFIFRICEAETNWDIQDFIQTQIEKIKETVGDKQVILGLSGGVDSSVAAILIHRAIGNQLTCIFVDTGLLRKDEGKKVMEVYGQHFQLNIKLIDAKEQFFFQLKGVDDPEQKRKIIGKEFIEVFTAESRKFNDAEFLAQGTIYPDVIESLAVKGGVAVKSHHNVGGLPDDMKLALLEPLRDLFKDEVRKAGLALGLPKELVYRHPFPGPGLGVRILGAIDEDKVRILQEADAIFTEELYRHNLYDNVSQAFVVLLPVKSVGFSGDQRTYEYTAVLRSADTIDFMTATWSKLPYDFLELVSNRIIKEVNGINRLAYDISSKPPATIEWE